VPEKANFRAIGGRKATGPSLRSPGVEQIVLDSRVAWIGNPAVILSNHEDQ